MAESFQPKPFWTLIPTISNPSWSCSIAPVCLEFIKHLADRVGEFGLRSVQSPETSDFCIHIKGLSSPCQIWGTLNRRCGSWEMIEHILLRQGNMSLRLQDKHVNQQVCFSRP